MTEKDQTMVPQHTNERDPSVDIHAYLDGELGPDEAAEVEAYLQSDAEAMARFEHYAGHKDLIREAGGSGTPEVTDLKTAALERQLAAKLSSRAAHGAARPWRVVPLQIAAAVALVAAGWIGHAQYAPSADGEPGYVAEALGAHQVFAHDFIRPAEFGPDVNDEALAWLSTKLGQSVEVPALGPVGLELVGLRLLGTAEGALAYFLYEKPDGTRVSLTLSRHPDGEPAVKFATYGDHGRHVGYWSTGSLDYALVAESDSAVREIAAEVDQSVTF